MLDAEEYAIKHKMGFFEISPLCNFNIMESFVELSRMALQRNGMERLWRSNKGKYSKKKSLQICWHILDFVNWATIIVFLYFAVLQLKELCCRAIVSHTTVYGIEQLPLPNNMKHYLKSYAMNRYSTHYRSLPIKFPTKKLKFLTPNDAANTSCATKKSCVII